MAGWRQVDSFNTTQAGWRQVDGFFLSPELQPYGLGVHIHRGAANILTLLTLPALTWPSHAPQTNCLEELSRPAPDHQGVTGRSDWVHIFHSVLPVLPLHNVDEGRVASALRSACAALVAKHNTPFRTAGVAVWEMRFRVPGGAWRLLVSCPTGATTPTTLPCTALCIICA